ncbi:MAG: peptidylprolyl isomerase [Ferruginibacter sp.]
MKIFLSLFAFLIISGTSYSQVLINYGNNKVMKDEFLRAYNKNKNNTEDKAASMREYVNLYTNFKLKVKAAESLRYDTLTQLKFDLANFRTQVSESYLSDNKGIDRLVNEAINRSKKNVHVLHYYIKVNEGTDTMKAFMAAREIRDALASGNTDYAALAASETTKYTAVTQRDLGFITAFTLPYTYETLLYNTPAGGVTAPYRSKDAWHVFKVLETRADPGKWRVAQILLAFPPDATPEMKANVARQANELRERLAKGEAFGELARLFSNDKLTYTAEGMMPEFSTGKYAWDFEREVLKLKEGEISKPFATNYGYHIVKMLKHTPSSFAVDDPGTQFEIKQKVMQDARITAEKEKFANNLLKRLNYKKLNVVKDVDLYRYADSVLKNPYNEKFTSFPINNKPIVSFGSKILKGSDWLTYIRNLKITPEQYNGEQPKELWEQFIRNAAVNHYRENLEMYNDDFKYQVQEFKEGNMLFEIMEKNVWNKAFSDTLGLKKIYDQNKSKYTWDKSADVIMVNAGTVELANEIMGELKNGLSFRDVMIKYANNAQGDSGRFDFAQIPGIEALTAPGQYSSVVTNTDGTAYFVKLVRQYPDGGQRNFDEARGMAINDYQAALEKEWIASLRKKYPVTVNEALLKQMSN